MLFAVKPVFKTSITPTVGPEIVDIPDVRSTPAMGVPKFRSPRWRANGPLVYAYRLLVPLVFS
jgi:hypothetical protein